MSTQATAPKEPKVDKGEALYERKLLQHLTKNSMYFILTDSVLVVVLLVLIKC